MNILQLLYKSVMGMLVGINLGAVLGGIVGAAVVGPEWVIMGMILGAMAGSLLGSAVGFLRNVSLELPAAERRPALSPVRVQYVPVRSHDGR